MIIWVNFAASLISLVICIDVLRRTSGQRWHITAVVMTVFALIYAVVIPILILTQIKA